MCVAKRRGVWGTFGVLLVLLVLPPCNSDHSTFQSGLVPSQDAQTANGRLFESESSWHQFQRLVPPRRSPSRETTAEDEDETRMTLLLDLDKTCFYGNDGNDLALSLQYMGKSRETVLELFKRMINPNLRPTFERYKGSWQNVDVVVYTRRPNLLLYHSVLSGQIVEMRYSPHWHDAGRQLHIPPLIRNAGDAFARYSGEILTDEEVHDVQKSLERLLCARDAIASELGMVKPPRIVVTAYEKDIDVTAQHLRFSPKNAVLYDDNEHLGVDDRVVLVQPFVALPAAQRQEVARYMEEVLPVRNLDPDLVEYLESAEAHERCLKMNMSSGRLQWWVEPCSKMGKWDLAQHLHRPGAAEGGSRMQAARARMQRARALAASVKEGIDLHLRKAASCMEEVSRQGGFVVDESSRYAGSEGPDGKVKMPDGDGGDGRMVLGGGSGKEGRVLTGETRATATAGEAEMEEDNMYVRQYSREYVYDSEAVRARQSSWGEAHTESDSPWGDSCKDSAADRITSHVQAGAQPTCHQPHTGVEAGNKCLWGKMCPQRAVSRTAIDALGLASPVSEPSTPTGERSDYKKTSAKPRTRSRM